MATEMLSVTEKGELDDLEAVIERGLETFVEVGNALLTIRDRRLWKGEFPDFTGYCQVRWGFSGRRANQLIEAASVIGEVQSSNGNNCSPNGSGDIKNEVLPANEGQARELAKAPEGERAAAWNEAVDTAPKVNGKPKVTAAHVQQVVAKRMPPPEPDEVDDAVEAVFGGVDVGAKTTTVAKVKLVEFKSRRRARVPLEVPAGLPADAAEWNRELDGLLVAIDTAEAIARRWLDVGKGGDGETTQLRNPLAAGALGYVGTVADLMRVATQVEEAFIVAVDAGDKPIRFRDILRRVRRES